MPNWTFYKMYFIQMPQMYVKMINVGKKLWITMFNLNKNMYVMMKSDKYTTNA